MLFLIFPLLSNLLTAQLLIVYKWDLVIITKVSKVVRFALSYLRKEAKRGPIKPSTLNSSFGMTRPYLHNGADTMALDCQLIMHFTTTLCVIG